MVYVAFLWMPSLGDVGSSLPPAPARLASTHAPPANHIGKGTGQTALVRAQHNHWMAQGQGRAPLPSGQKPVHFSFLLFHTLTSSCKVRKPGQGLLPWGGPSQEALSSWSLAKEGEGGPRSLL